MATQNGVGVGLVGSTGIGAFVGGTAPTITLPIINNTVPGYSTTVTAGANTTLTVNSNYKQFFTGSTTQSVIMPVTSTLTPGMAWLVVNNSSDIVTVKSSGLNNIIALSANSSSEITCIGQAGTSATDWDAEGQTGAAGVDSITGTANQVVASAAIGPVILSLPQSIATTSAVQFNTVRLNASDILDSNGNIASHFPAATTAVNYFSLQNSAAASALALAALGSDTNIAMNISGKGTSGVNIQGRTDATTVPAGYYGQIISSNIPFASPVSIPGTPAKSLTSISLTAGTWLIFGNINFTANGVVMNETLSGINTVDNTLPDQSQVSVGSPNSVDSAGSCAPIQFVSISTTTIYYIVGAHGSASAGPTMCGNLIGVRLG